MPSHTAAVYHIQAVIWTGEIAEICRAVSPRGQTVAIKRIRRGIKGRGGAMRSLEHEATIGLALDHPNVIGVLEYVPDPDGPVMVMEFFPSRNVKVRLLTPRGDRLLDYHTGDVVRQMAAGLGHLHERDIIHMDLKPENYLLADDGQLKLADFAIAAHPARGWRRLIPSLRRRIAGSRSYIAPETLRRKAPDFRTDIYSLGATLYELLAHRPPFSAADRDELLSMHLHRKPASMRSANSNLTPEIDALVLCMLEKDPGRRPQSVAEVAARLERLPIHIDPPVESQPKKAER